MKRVTDPELLRQLESAAPEEPGAPAGLKPVTDERILLELENSSDLRIKPGRTMTDKLKRQAGLMARAAGPVGVGAILGGTAGSVLPGVGTALGATAGAGAASLTQLIDRLAGTKYVDTLMDRLGLPKTKGPYERVAQDVTGAMAGQAGIISAGRVMARSAGPVVQRVGELLKTAPGLQTAAAAAGPAAGGIVRERGGTPSQQFATNIGATLAVPVAAGMVREVPQAQKIKDLLLEAKKRNVDLSYADITQGGGARRLDTMLEQAPIVGTSRFREQGAKKVTAAIEEFGDEALLSMRGEKYRGLEALKTSAAQGDKAARNTLEQIQNAGDDWTKIMQASGNLKLWRSRQAAEKLYDRVEALAKTRGEVPLTKTNAALDAAIEAETKSVIPDKELLDTLNKVKTGLYGTDPTARSRDFTTIRQLRSDIGDIVNSYYQGKNAAVGAKGVGSLQSLKNALEADMETFATTGGADLKNAWQRADSFYRRAVVPFKDKALAQALKSDLPDEIYKKFIQVSRSGAGEDRAIKFYDALDPKGKAAVRYGMIANAIEKASIPERGGILSPGKFEQSLESIDPAARVFFRGDAKKELDGFQNLMEHSRRFGQYLENPPTGQRVIPWLSLGLAAIRPGEVAGVGGAAYVTRILVTTETGKRLLLDAARLRPGTPEMQRVVEEISKQIPRIASQQPEQRGTERESQRRPAPQGVAAGAMP